MKALILLLALFQSWPDAAAFLEGAASPEELDSETYERYEHLAAHPLELNSIPLRALQRSGLLDPYRCACIDDYRTRCGPVASYTELGAIDGIGPDTAAALRFFTRLDAGSLTGAPDGAPAFDAALKTSVRRSYSSPSTAASAAMKSSLKYRGYELDAAFNAAAAARKASFCLSGTHLFAGDFNARFGHGLGLWTGTSMNTLRKASSFIRGASGLTACRSYSGVNAIRGIGAELTPGPITISAFAGTKASAPQELLLGANARYLSHRGTYGISYYHTGKLREQGVCALLSADAHLTLGHFGLWGEMALSGAPAFVAGVSWYPAYRVTLAAALRCYPAGYSGFGGGAFSSYGAWRDERGLSLALDAGPFSITADAALRPEAGKYKHRAVALYEPSWHWGSVEAGARLRYAPSYTDGGWKHDCRAVFNICAHDGVLNASLRADRVIVPETGGKGSQGLSLSAEAGWRGDLTVFLNAGIFATDGYESRIYIYERDIPGSFNVPSYYGHGWHCGLYAAWKCLYLQAGFAALKEKGIRENVHLGLKIRI